MHMYELVCSCSVSDGPEVRPLYVPCSVHLCSILACQPGHALLMVTPAKGCVHQESLFVPPLTCAILLPWQLHVMGPM